MHLLRLVGVSNGRREHLQTFASICEHAITALFFFGARADVNCFGTSKLTNSHRLVGKEILLDLFNLFIRNLSWSTRQAQMAAKWLRYNLFISFWFRHGGRSTDS